MTSRIINKQILQLAIPSILSGITIPLVGMADTAISGRLGSAAAIGGLAIGSMLFDLLYWNFGFLRVGTAGVVAQAYGRKDFSHAVRTGLQGLLIAWAFSLLVLLIQWPFAQLILWITPTSEQVETFARQYFFTRIWAAPAVLPLFVLRGWFIGMQDTLSSMVMDIVINLTNVGMSLLLALGCQMGVRGIALGTVMAQYTGLLLGFALLFFKYRKKIPHVHWQEVWNKEELRHFFGLSGNLFLRSICMLLIYNGFTYLAAQYGDVLLAVATIMMKLLLLYSYIVDGFAYAGEALTGKFIGARDKAGLVLSSKWLFLWAAVVGALSTVGYVTLDQALLHLMTSTEEVIQAAHPFLPWLYIMPFISCLTFMWDGIYIGATASGTLRNAMIASVVAFYVCYFALKGLWGIQALWAGYAAHLIMRSLWQTAAAKKRIYALV